MDSSFLRQLISPSHITYLVKNSFRVQYLLTEYQTLNKNQASQKLQIRMLKCLNCKTSHKIVDTKNGWLQDFPIVQIIFYKKQVKALIGNMNEPSRIKKQKSPPFDYSMKMMIIGDSGVGKSSLLYRYQQNKFTQNYIMTVGMNYVWKIEQVENIKIKLQIWDTAGQERYKTITQNYYKNSDGAIISFSIDSRESFISVRNWIEQLTDTARGNIQILLVGTKCDLIEQREVDKEQAEQFAKQNKLPYVECSAKSGESVNQLFRKLTIMMKHNVIDVRLRQDSQKNRESTKLSGVKGVHRRCC